MSTRPKVVPTQIERTFGEDEVIVSKTDPTGRITYANDLFLRIADYTERDVLGAPHSIIRHPDMPRGLFKLLWDTLGRGEEIFAYIKNMAANGDHYWVFAHVTPSFDHTGRLLGYHSNRRRPDPFGVKTAEALYREMKLLEAPHAQASQACAASLALLQEVLDQHRATYSELMFRWWEGRE